MYKITDSDIEIIHKALNLFNEKIERDGPSNAAKSSYLWLSLEDTHNNQLIIDFPKSGYIEIYIFDFISQKKKRSAIIIPSDPLVPEDLWNTTYQTLTKFILEHV